MTEKKMRKWLKTFVMLLPVVFVMLFGVHLHRHDLPNEVSVGNPEEVQTVYYNFEYGSNTYSINPDTAQFIYYEVGYPQFVSGLSTIELPSGDAVNVFYMGDLSADDYAELYINIQTNELIYYYDDSYNLFPPQDFANLITIDEVVIDLYVVSFNLDVNSTTSQSVVNLTVDQLLSYDTEDVYTDYIVYDEPLEIIGYEFNNYLDQFYKFDIFNLTQFYDWSVNTFFNGTAPLYYKPVFSLLVYEFVIELLFLMFSFITFLIRFAQKWIDGLYERRF